MVKYSLIMEYLKKGNNYSQIATLCGCSRTTVWEVVKRIDYFKIQLADFDGIDEVGLRSILFPERVWALPRIATPTIPKICSTE